MRTLTCICLLLGTSLAAGVEPRTSSFAGEYGAGGGTTFSFSSEQLNGQITGMRVCEDINYVLGIQFRYGNDWSPYYGRASCKTHEVLLASGESITQVSGKTYSYVHELIFITNHGRFIRFGQPYGNSFNDFPLYSGTALRYVSGRYSTLLHSIGFHWGVQPGCVHCKDVQA